MGDDGDTVGMGDDGDTVGVGDDGDTVKVGNAGEEHDSLPCAVASAATSANIAALLRTAASRRASISSLLSSSSEGAAVPCPIDAAAFLALPAAVPLTDVGRRKTDRLLVMG